MEGLAEFRSATVELLLGKGAAAVKEVSARIGEGVWGAPAGIASLMQPVFELQLVDLQSMPTLVPNCSLQQFKNQCSTLHIPHPILIFPMSRAVWRRCRASRGRAVCGWLPTSLPSSCRGRLCTSPSPRGATTRTSLPMQARVAGRQRVPRGGTSREHHVLMMASLTWGFGLCMIAYSYKIVTRSRGQTTLHQAWSGVSTPTSTPRRWGWTLPR